MAGPWTSTISPFNGIGRQSLCFSGFIGKDHVFEKRLDHRIADLLADVIDIKANNFAYDIDGSFPGNQDALLNPAENGDPKTMVLGVRKRGDSRIGQKAGPPVDDPASDRCDGSTRITHYDRNEHFYSCIC